MFTIIDTYKLRERKKQVTLAFRNKINKTTGQEQLIQEYNALIQALAQRSDSMEASDEKKQLLSEIERIDETSYTVDKGNIIYMGGFNPYNVFQKKRIRNKIQDAKNVCAKFNIKLNERINVATK